ncbi:DNA repair protein [candidate division KSB3 bacterium]|nr:MAG: DNA repair protein [candidate division KSB3 bacterium]
MLHVSRCMCWAISACVLLFSGCQTAYYAAWETLGQEKRHLLRSNVEKAGKEQQEASEQFQETLTRIQEIYGFDGGELEKAYRRLKSDYERSVDRADDVRHRIKRVEQIAADLFAEWDREIQQIGNSSMQAGSREALYKTKSRYSVMYRAMQRAERRMDPVLKQMNDYLLYLKHNLNAQAIGALEQEAVQIGLEVDALIQEMNESIREAETFLKDFE